MGKVRRAGQIVSRGEDKWLVRIFLGRDDDGRKHYRNWSVTGSKKDAQRVLNQKTSELETGRLTEKTRQTVASFLNDWLNNVARTRLKERTFEDYGGIIARYIVEAPLGRSRLDTVTPLSIQAFYGELMARGLSARTVRNCHTVIRQALRQAVRWRLLAHNPALDVDLPKARPKELCCLGPDEAIRFLAAAAEDRYFFFWTFMLATGVRFGEAAAVRWEDVDWSAATVAIVRSLFRPKGGGWRLVEPKTKKSRRSILLLPSLLMEMREHRTQQLRERLAIGPAHQDHGLVFTSTCGSPVDCNNLRNKHLRPSCAGPGCRRRFGSMTFATRAQPCFSPPARTRRSCRSASVIPRSR